MAFVNVADECQGNVTTCRFTRDDDVLGQESDLADKMLVCRN